MFKLNLGKIKKAAIFTIVNFWPVLIVLSLMAYLMYVSLSFSTRRTITDYLEIFVLLFIPIFLITICYKICINANWKKRGYAIYLTWVFLTLEVCFIFSAAAGGMSQAVVEGVAGSRWARYLDYVSWAVMLTVYSHVILIPWVFISLFSMKKIGEDKFF